MRRQLAIWGIVVGLTGGMSVAVLASSPQSRSPSKSQPQTKTQTKTQTKSKAPQPVATKTGQSRPGQSTSRKRVPLSKKQHATVMSFARQHHAELADLLQQLRQRNNSQYNQAAAELHADVERLERLRQRSPDRHRLELELWKLDSHIKLLAARLTMSKKPEVETQLKQALLQRVNLRLLRLRAEQSRLKTRVDRINSAIDELETQPEKAVEVDWKKLQNSLRKNQKRKHKRRVPETELPAAARTPPPRP